MNPSSDIVMCEKTLPISCLRPVASGRCNVSGGERSSVTDGRIPQLAGTELVRATSPNQPALALAMRRWVP
jgi:hypothetical protein